MPSYPPSGSGGSSFAPPAAEELQKLLPKYEFLGFIGQGPMGTVYKARQPQLDRLVAVKLFPVPAGSGHDFIQHFDRGAKTMARLSHPRIVTVHDFGRVELPAHDTPALYLVTEFVKGDSLEHVAEKRDFDQKEVLAIVTQVCDALKYAHEHGVIHRDIRPNNTMFDAEGMVKVSDFGLAKLMGADLFQSQLTMANQSMRTMDYIAPEQLEPGRDVDQRADVYSVGVMLYKLLCGRLPRGTFVMPSERNPELDTRLDDIIVRAMQSEPEDRYPDMTALWQDIDRVRTAPTIITGKVKAQAPAGKLITGKIQTQTSPQKLGTGKVETTPPVGKLLTGKVSEKLPSAAHSNTGTAPTATTNAPSRGPRLALPLTAAAFLITASLALLAWFFFKSDTPDPHEVSKSKKPIPAKSKPDTKRPLPVPAPPDPDRFTPRSAPKSLPPIPLADAAPALFTITPDDGPLDLIALTDPSADTLTGLWTLIEEDTRKIQSSPKGASKLSLPARPKGSYRIRASFTRTGGERSIGFQLPFGPYRATWFFDHGPSSSSALEYIDGRSITGPNNPTRVHPGKLESHRLYAAEFTVRLLDSDQCEFSVTLDGEPYASWTGRPSDLEPYKGWALPDPNALGLITDGSPYEIHELQLELLDGEAEILRHLPLNLARPTIKGTITPIVRNGPAESIAEFGPPPPAAANAVMAALPTADTAGMILLSPDGTLTPWIDPDLNTSGPPDIFTKIPGNLSGIVDIALGQNHAIVLKKDGTVVTWGHNSQGQSKIPENLRRCVQIAAGYALSVALQDDGTVVAWGGRNSGFNPDQVPPGLGPVRAIAAGDHHVLALQEDGTLVGWGSNEHRQSQFTVPEGGGEIIAIGAWGYDSFVLTDRNNLYHFGQSPANDIPDLIPDALAFVPGRNCVAVLTAAGEWNFHGAGTVARLQENAGGATSVAMGKRFIAALKPSPDEHQNWLASIISANPSTADTASATPAFTGIPGLPGSTTPNPSSAGDTPYPTGEPSTPDAPKTEANQRLDELLTKYKEGYQQTILQDFQSKIASLNDGFIKALQRTEQNIAASGNLERVLAARQAIENATQAENNPIPPIDLGDNPPKRLIDLRLAYDNKISELTDEHDTQLVALLPPLDRNLDALQRKFTQEEKIEEALKIKATRASFQANGLPFGIPNTPAAPTTPIAATTPGNGTPESTEPPAAPAQFPKNIPPDAIRVTPEGTNNTLTLDNALQKAKRGQTIALAAGAYPPSATAMEKYNSNAYHVETPGLTLLGNKSKLPSLSVRADDVTLLNLGFENLSISNMNNNDGEKSPAKNVSIRNCRFDFLGNAEGAEFHADNCIGAIHLYYYGEATIKHCTLIGNDSDSFLGQQIGINTSSRIENSILAGNPYAIQIKGSGPEDATIRKCLVHGSRGLVGREGPPATPSDPPSVVKLEPRDAQREYNVRFSNCIENDPLFISPGGGDFRLAPASPAKGQGENGKDLGAQLTADGWPITP